MTKGEREALQELDRAAWRGIYVAGAKEPIWRPLPFLDEWCETLRRHGCYKILDAACGDAGQMSAMPEDFLLVGLDQSATAIACGEAHLQRANRQNYTLVQGEVERCPFPDSSFDAVLFIDVLSMFLNPAEVLDEFRRVLKPDGLLLVSTFASNDPIAELVEPFTTPLAIPGTISGTVDKRFINVLYSLSGIADVMTSAGFQVVDVYERRDPEEVHPGFRETKHEHVRIVATCQSLQPTNQEIVHS